MIPSAEWNAAKRSQTLVERERLAKWLGVPVTHEWAAYAVLPFAVVQTDDGAAPCAALIPPLVYFDMSAPVGDWPLHRMGRCDTDSDVVRCDTGMIYRAPGPALVMPGCADGEVIAYTDAKSWARAWARKRLQFMQHRKMMRSEMGVEAVEPLDGGQPGALLIGDVSKIKAWPSDVRFKAPDADTAKIINISIWRAARLARAA